MAKISPMLSKLLNDVSIPSDEAIVEINNGITEDATELSENNEVATELLNGIEETTEAIELVETVGLQSGAKDIVSAKLLANRLSNAVKKLDSSFKLNFIKADNDFFSSLIYPTEVKNKNWSYEGVDLSALKELKFGWLSDDQLAEWLGATHPDVIKCLRDSDVALSDSFQQLTDLNNMCKMFTHEGNVFNFAHVKTVQTYNLFQMYFILTKMYLSDTPISALQSGSMETYRAWVNMLWNAMTLQLIKVKNLCNNFRARTIVLFDNDKPIEIVNGKIRQRHVVIGQHFQCNRSINNCCITTQ
jgi:hypothetical protein